MAVTNTVLADVVGTGSLADIYTAASGVLAKVQAASFCNTTAGVVALTLKLVARTSATAQTIVNGKNVGIGETFSAVDLLNQVVEPGGIIQFQGLGLEAYISGLEIVA